VQQAGGWRVAVVPIPGTTKLAHLDENVAAIEIELDPEELARITVAHESWGGRSQPRRRRQPHKRGGTTGTTDGS
jgi:diketogulonate reductase-like aldo/keto reductase